jgi:polar amino acid transport system permease protein
VLRGTPFLIQLFLLYFGGPFMGLSLDPAPAGLLGLAVYGAAYFSEIFRAGFEAVPRGHVEAAECVGLGRFQIVRRILVPEMTMLVLPACTNMAIILLKETAILSTITVPELTFTVSNIGTENYAFVEAFFVLALVYWGLVELSGRLSRFAESRLSKFRFATA